MSMYEDRQLIFQESQLQQRQVTTTAADTSKIFLPSLTIKKAMTLFDEIDLFQSQNGVAVKGPYHVAEKVKLLLSNKNHLSETQFRMLSNDKLFHMIRKHLCPKSPSDFTSQIMFHVEYDLGPNPRLSSDLAVKRIYDASLEYSKKYLNFFEFMYCGQDKDDIPAATSDKGGLIHTFFKGYPQRLGEQILLAMKNRCKSSYTLDTFSRFIDDFNEVIHKILYVPYELWMPVKRQIAHFEFDYSALKSTREKQFSKSTLNLVRGESDSGSGSDSDSSERIFMIAGEKLSNLNFHDNPKEEPKAKVCYKFVLSDECKDRKEGRRKFDLGYGACKSAALDMVRRLIKKYGLNVKDLNLILEATISSDGALIQE